MVEGGKAGVAGLALGFFRHSAWAQPVKLRVATDVSGPCAGSPGQGAIEATRMAAQDLHAALGAHPATAISPDEAFRPHAQGGFPFVAP